MRFKKLEKFEDILSIYNLFSELSIHHKASFQYKVILEKENHVHFFLEELQNSSSSNEFIIEKIDRFFYIKDAPVLKSELVECYEEIINTSPFVPFWCIISVIYKEKEIYLDIQENIPFFKPGSNINNEKVVEKLKNFLDKTTDRANTLILIQDLKENLQCPNNLIIAEEPFQKQDSVEMNKQSTEKKNNSTFDFATKTGETPSLPQNRASKQDPKNPFRSSKMGFKKPNKSTNESELNQLIDKQVSNRKTYKVPLVYRKYFVIYFTFEKGKFLKSLLSYFFSNFLVQNKTNLCMGLYEKEIYILNFDTKDFKDIEHAQHFEPLPDEIIKTKNSCIELNIYSMNGININALNYFTKHIIYAKSSEEIKLICNSLLRNDKARLSKDISDYLLDEKNKITISYKLPEYIQNLPYFLFYLRQNFLKKLFTHNTVSTENSLILSSTKNIFEQRDSIDEQAPLSIAKNSMAKRTFFSEAANNKQLEEEMVANALLLNPSKSSIISKKSIDISLEKSDYSFMFNFLRELNGLPILREQIFGWCVFMMFVSTQYEFIYFNFSYILL